MSFLSIDQRQAAHSQMAAYVALLETDAEVLEKQLSEMREVISLHTQAANVIVKAMNGDLDADTLERIDGVCRERLMYGIPHYPLAIGSQPKVVVHGRWP